MNSVTWLTVLSGLLGILFSALAALLENPPRGTPGEERRASAPSSSSWTQCCPYHDLASSRLGYSLLLSPLGLVLALGLLSRVSGLELLTTLGLGHATEERGEAMLPALTPLEERGWGSADGVDWPARGQESQTTRSYSRILLPQPQKAMASVNNNTALETLVRDLKLSHDGSDKLILMNLIHFKRYNVPFLEKYIITSSLMQMKGIYLFNSVVNYYLCQISSEHSK